MVGVQTNMANKVVLLRRRTMIQVTDILLTLKHLSTFEQDH